MRRRGPVRENTEHRELPAGARQPQKGLNIPLEQPAERRKVTKPGRVLPLQRQSVRRKAGIQVVPR